MNCQHANFCLFRVKIKRFKLQTIFNLLITCIKPMKCARICISKPKLCYVFWVVFDQISKTYISLSAIFCGCLGQHLYLLSHIIIVFHQKNTEYYTLYIKANRSYIGSFSFRIQLLDACTYCKLEFNGP